MPNDNMIFKSFADAIPIEQNSKTGFVKLIGNVYGIVDLVNDVVEFGAFSDAKAKDIKFMDNHDYSSVTNIIAKPLDVYEVDRTRLPENIRDQFPNATGALVLNVQFPMNVSKSREIYNAIISGLVKEFSIGFNIVKQRRENVKVDGKTTTVRVIEKARLKEVSSVINAANQATQVLEFRSNGLALEAKRKQLLSELDHQRFLDMNVFQKDAYIRSLMISKLIQLKSKK